MKLSEKRYKAIILCYIASMFIVCLFYQIKYCNGYKGEWDDYSLVTASIMNDGNFSISKDDIQKARELYPEWTSNIDNYSLSGFKNKDGNELSWYFGSYSAACVPVAIFLSIIKKSCIYAFPITNVLALTLSLLGVYFNKSISWKKKLCLILLLTINPILYYLSWPSGEVFIYSFLILTMNYWLTNHYKKAAICLSIASTLNPVILFIGLIMIIDYFIEFKRINMITGFKGYLMLLKKNIRDIIKFGMCFITGLVPLAYNYYNTGYINLTAGTSGFFNDDSVLSRWAAYLFDLNFGILPHFTLLFVLYIFLSIYAIIKKKTKFVLISLAFYGVILSYSLMSHINSGMESIARYNSWSSVVMIFGLVLLYDTFIVKRKHILEIVAFATVILSSLNIISYKVSNLSYVDMSPLATFVLNNAPNIYNPLPSTFNSRCNHIDGGYVINAPVYYSDDDGCIRKILVNRDSINQVLTDTSGDEKSLNYLKNKLSKIKKSEFEYISISKTYNLYVTTPYSIGDTIWFSSDKRNADIYVVKGLSANEIAYAWTDGKEMKMRLNLINYSGKKLHMIIDIGGTYNGSQKVKVYSNNNQIYEYTISNENRLEFDIPKISGNELNLVFKFPDAISPINLGQSQDARALALALKKAIIIQE